MCGDADSLEEPEPAWTASKHAANEREAVDPMSERIGWASKLRRCAQYGLCCLPRRGRPDRNKTCGCQVGDARCVR